MPARNLQQRAASPGVLRRTALAVTLALPSCMGTLGHDRFQYHLYANPAATDQPLARKSLTSTADLARFIDEECPLRSGDWVVSRSPVPRDHLPGLMVQSLPFFNHSGVILNVDGAAYVIEARSTFDPDHVAGKAQQVLGMFTGKLQRTPLAEYLTWNPHSLFVRGTDATASARLASTVDSWQKAGIATDPYFDLDSPPLYSNEMLWKAMVQSGFPTPLVSPRAAQPTHEPFLRDLGLNAARFITADALAQMGTPLATVYYGPSQTMAEPLREATLYLHERFAKDRPLTDLLVWDAENLVAFSPCVLFYFDLLKGFFKDHSLTTATERQAIYARLYGFAFQDFSQSIPINQAYQQSQVSTEGGK